MIVSKIKQIMKEKNKTLRGLAQEASISDKTLDRARGALISESRMSTLEAIAKALGVKVKDLFDEIPDPPAGAEQAGANKKALRVNQRAKQDNFV